jgi:hypothetical protein
VGWGNPQQCHKVFRRHTFWRSRNPLLQLIGTLMPLEEKKLAQGETIWTRYCDVCWKIGGSFGSSVLPVFATPKEAEPPLMWWPKPRNQECCSGGTPLVLPAEVWCPERICARGVGAGRGLLPLPTTFYRCGACPGVPCAGARRRGFGYAHLCVLAGSAVHRSMPHPMRTTHKVCAGATAGGGESRWPPVPLPP